MTVLAVMLLAAGGLGWWAARRASGAVEYFAAGRRAGAWLVGVAGTAAAVSAFTFVGGPGLFAVAGVGSLWIVLSAPITGALQCWAAGEPVVALARRTGALTLPELLASRFAAPAVQAAAAAVVVVGCVASLAVQARAAVVLGDAFLALPGAVAAVAVMAATTAYTAAGGMRAGLLADAVQGTVMALAALILAGAALHAAGGPVAAFATLADHRPELLGSFGAIPPARALGWYLLFALGTCAQPHYLQKFLLLRGPAELRRLPAVLTATLGATLAVWLGVGLAGAALVASGRLDLARPDDLAPRTIALLGPGAVLLAGVAVLAAIMSTSASFLNLAAAALTRDLPAALGRPAGGVGAARAATAAVAVAATAAGVGSDRAVALLGIAGWGFFTAALLPTVVVGLAWPGATARGAVAAILAGAGADILLELTRPAFFALEPGLAGAAVGTLALVGVSLRR